MAAAHLKGIVPMQKGKNSSDKVPRKLHCPVCDVRIHREFKSPHGSHLVPEAGQLTQCDRCLSMLEYVLDERSLVLRAASQRRVTEFNRLAQATHEPNVAELINYVIQYRRMPTPIRHRGKR
jgi:hypothetical protein